MTPSSFDSQMLDIAPGDYANIHQFTDLRTRYASGYFVAALERLIDDKHVEPLRGGLFLRLQPSGYALARGE
ncbi:hypothetical protein ACNSPR_29190 [Klebsiella pneumoniae]